MLPADYKFVLYNDCGQTIIANSGEVTIDQYYINPSDGKVDRVDSPTTHVLNEDVVNGDIAQLGSAESGEEYTGLHGEFYVTTDNASADGNVILGIMSSQDGGSTWPSGAVDFDPDQDLDLVSIISLNGAQSRRTNFEL